VFSAGQSVGNYRILAKLGTGGMGAVYLAEHPLIGKKVALKVIHRELAGNREVVQRFFQEARAVNTIGHENIVEIHDFGQTPEGDHFYIMEYLDGRTLASVISRERRLEVLRALHIGIQLCNGLGAAHACGVIHRDLKPDNVMLLSRPGSPDFVKILDFGLAKMFASGNAPLTAMGVILGTPQYMSPEACESKRDVDHRTDVYAVGVLLFQMLTGVLPFDGVSMGEVLVKQVTQLPPAPRGLCPDIPPSVEQIVLRCLAKSADGRFQTMMALRDALSDPDGYLASSPPMAAARSIAPGEGPTAAAVTMYARARTSEPMPRPGTEQGAARTGGPMPAAAPLGHAPTVGMAPAPGPTMGLALAPTANQVAQAPARPAGMAAPPPGGPAYGPSGPTIVAGARPGTGPIAPAPGAPRAGAEARTMMAPGLGAPMPGGAPARESGVVPLPPVIENRTMVIATPVGYRSSPGPRWRVITIAAAATLVVGAVVLVALRGDDEPSSTAAVVASSPTAVASAVDAAAAPVVVDAATASKPVDAAPAKPVDAAAARDAQAAPDAAARPALEVQVDTVPPGASIWVAGVDRGVAPVTLRFDSTTTRVTVEARLAGYVTKKQTIDVTDKMSLQLNLRKARRGGRPNGDSSDRPPPGNDLMRP
jgi:serine/threonine-protein kinase